jgi:hypothetical protein
MNHAETDKGILLKRALMDVKKEDGLGSNIDCVFANSWDNSYRRNAAGEETEPFRPRELLSIQQALDPLRHHSNMFCNYLKRNAQAQKLAHESKRNVAVASVTFSYPYFDRDLNTATVFYTRRSDVYLPQQGKRWMPEGSNGVILFVRRNGVWSFTIRTMGIMD